MVLVLILVRNLRNGWELLLLLVRHLLKFPSVTFRIFGCYKDKTPKKKDHRLSHPSASEVSLTLCDSPIYHEYKFP